MQVTAHHPEDLEQLRQYCQQQKEYALKLIGEYGVRAAARILEIPRSDLSPEISAIDEVRISL